MIQSSLRLTAVIVLVMAAVSASAATHCVPNSFSASCDDSHATIQAAIDDSVAGDTVLVAPGTYVENLTIDVDITLQGAQAGVDARGRVTGAPNPATESIIAPASLVALTLIAGSAGSTIDGFSFLGGTRSIESGAGPLDNLLITNNHFAGFTNAGIFLNDTGIDITVSRNVIDGTSKTGGGGLFHLDTDGFAGFRLEDNIIRNGNSATGFFVDGNNNVVASVNRAPRLAGNLIIDNNTGMNLGSRSFDGGMSGAFIENNTFESNNFDGLQGGPQNTTIQNNIFRDNGRSGLALTSFGNTAADRGAQNVTISCNGFSGNLQEALFFSATQAAGTIATNQAHNNNIAGNTAGGTYNGTETINVDNNWWGSPTGPTVASNPGGTGDSLAGTGAAFFDYTPFLTFVAVCVPGQPAPALAIDKIVSNPTPAEGSAVTFTITITNSGGPATLVSVTDLLPAGLTYSSDMPSQGTYTPGTGVWDVGTVNSPGGTASLQITATVNAGTAGMTITNTATLTSSTPADSTAADNSDSVSVTVAQPDLAVAKGVNNATPMEGDSVTFTVTVTNVGAAPASAVTISDLLPPGLTFVSSTPSQGSYVSGTGVWTVGPVAPAGTATLQIVATVNPGTAGSTITNTASLTVSMPADPAPGNNSDSESIIVAQPDLSILKTANSPQTPSGFPVTFTIVVTNSGSGNATSVTVTDILPAGLTYDSSTPSQGTYDPVSGVWAVGAVAAGANATLQIVATVSAPAGTTVTNTATITASTPSDATPGNNSSSAPVDAFDPTAIPSLSVMGLMMLAVVLGAIALLKLR
ncbi:MAG TPA: hypothetical protein VMS98_07080 [Thermoanaerobaculia bacterium]|nr:hypothetical protein [Thermoanaerobaculia bacterium]